MPTYKIKQVPEDILKFRRSTNSEDLLAYKDELLDPKSGILQIAKYDKESITVDSTDYPSSLVLFKNQVFCWEIIDPKNIRLHHFDIVKIINPPVSNCCILPRVHHHRTITTRKSGCFYQAGPAAPRH